LNADSRLAASVCGFRGEKSGFLNRRYRNLPNYFGKIRFILMGGIGSGNWYRWSKRDTVEDCRSIDIRSWQREGLLMPGHWFGWQWTRDGETVASIGVGVEAGPM
jgi:hypothetical protein